MMEPVRYFFIRRGIRISGPFPAAKMINLDENGQLDDDSEWSPDKKQWNPVSELPWRREETFDSPDTSDDPISMPVRDDEPIQIKTFEPSDDSPRMFVRVNKDRSEDRVPVSREENSNAATGERFGEERVRAPDPLPSAPPAANRAPGESLGEFLGEIASLLWKPAHGTRRIYSKYGDIGAMQAGGILMLLSATLLFFILSNGIYPGSNTLLIPLSRFGAFFCIGIPISSIFFLLLLVRQFFGDTKQGGVGGDALIAGGFIWFATAFAAAILALGKMGRDGMLNPDSVAHHALTTVILSYGLVSASVSMFVGLTEISGVRRSSACPLIAFLGSTTWILCLLLLSTFNR